MAKGHGSLRGGSRPGIVDRGIIGLQAVRREMGWRQDRRASRGKTEMR